MTTRRLFISLFIALALQPSAWPADPVYINTPAGSERLLASRHRTQYFAVQPYIESQQHLAFCGPASIAAILNSLDIPRPPVPQLHPYAYFTQDNIFTPDTERIKTRTRVSTSGMTLVQTTEFLKALGVKAVAYHAEHLQLDELRALVTDALDAPDTRLLVNYDRRPLGQIGGGHISPLAAYDNATDSVLLLDVAKFKYPPTWIDLADLLAAMKTRDAESGQSRGLILIEKTKPPKTGGS